MKNYPLYVLIITIALAAGCKKRNTPNDKPPVNHPGDTGQGQEKAYFSTSFGKYKVFFSPLRREDDTTKYLDACDSLEIDFDLDRPQHVVERYEAMNKKRVIHVDITGFNNDEEFAWRVKDVNGKYSGWKKSTVHRDTSIKDSNGHYYIYRDAQDVAQIDKSSLE